MLWQPSPQLSVPSYQRMRLKIASICYLRYLVRESVPVRPYLITQALGGVRTLSIRRGNWKYLDHPGSGGNRYENNHELKPFIIPENAPGAPAQLYNLETDHGETKNLYYERQDIVKELKALLKQSKASGRSRP